MFSIVVHWPALVKWLPSAWVGDYAFSEQHTSLPYILKDSPHEGGCTTYGWASSSKDHSWLSHWLVTSPNPWSPIRPLPGRLPLSLGWKRPWVGRDHTPMGSTFLICFSNDTEGGRSQGSLFVCGISFVCSLVRTTWLPRTCLVQVRVHQSSSRNQSLLHLAYVSVPRYLHSQS